MAKSSGESGDSRQQQLDELNRELRSTLFYGGVAMAFCYIMLGDSPWRLAPVAFYALVLAYFALEPLLHLRQVRSLRAQQVAATDQVSALSIEDAQRRCEALLAADGDDRWEVRLASAPLARTDLPLGPVTEQFFNRYETVRELPWGLVFDRGLLAPSKMAPGMWCVGTTSPDDEQDVAGPDDYTVAPGEDAVTERWSCDPEAQTSLPSLYHWILYLAEERVAAFYTGGHMPHFTTAGPSTKLPNRSCVPGFHPDL